MAACGSRCEVPDVDVIIFLQLLQAGENSLLDEFLSPRSWRGGFTGLLQFCDSSLRGEASQSIDQNGIGLGDIEPDIGDFVGDKSIQDGKNRVFNDIERDNGSESLN